MERIQKLPMKLLLIILIVTFVFWIMIMLLNNLKKLNYQIIISFFTILTSILSFIYTAMQDKRISKKEEREIKAKYHSNLSFIHSDNEKNCIVIKNSNYILDNIDKRYYLLKNKDDNLDGDIYGFYLYIYLKNLSETFPSEFKIKTLQMFTLEDNPENKQLYFKFINIYNNSKFVKLSYNSNGDIHLSILNVFSKKTYEKILSYKLKNKKIHLNIDIEILNQFNVWTELELKGDFNIINKINETDKDKTIYLQLDKEPFTYIKETGIK